jgi:hypothetical protein
MNIEISAYVNYSGELDGIEKVARDIAGVLIKHGYVVNVSDDNSPVTSLVVLRETDLVKYTNPDDFLRVAIDNAVSIIVPTTEEEFNERSDDQRETGSVDSGGSSGEDQHG